MRQIVTPFCSSALKRMQTYQVFAVSFRILNRAAVPMSTRQSFFVSHLPSVSTSVREPILHDIFARSQRSNANGTSHIGGYELAKVMKLDDWIAREGCRYAAIGLSNFFPLGSWIVDPEKCSKIPHENRYITGHCSYATPYKLHL